MYEATVTLIPYKSNTSLSIVNKKVKKNINQKSNTSRGKKCEKIKKSKFGGIIFLNFASLRKG